MASERDNRGTIDQKKRNITGSHLRAKSLKEAERIVVCGLCWFYGNYYVLSRSCWWWVLDKG